ncbi:protein rolling stone-like [Lineus longissimus]|uniref:protein rolling stone-like n=1 Tax=Lineus longissimus TaxID=88925 RepID=UPI002B4C388B
MPENGCSGCCPGNECRLANFKLDHPHPRLFMTARWNVGQGWFVAYRVIAAAFWLSWTIASVVWNYGWYTYEENRFLWIIYLTDWNLTLMTLRAIVHASVAIYYLHRTRSGTLVFTSMPLYLRFLWVLFNLSTTAALVITGFYWVAAYADSTSLLSADLLNHAANTIYVIMDVIVVAIPYRILHIFQPMLYAVTYLVFAAIYQVSGGLSASDKPYIYRALDWIQAPKTAAMYTALSVFGVTPVAYAILFGLSKAREAIYDRWFAHKQNDQHGDFNEAFDYTELGEAEAASQTSRKDHAGTPLKENTSGDNKYVT